MNKIKNLIKGYYILLAKWNHHRNSNIWIFGEWFGKKCSDNCLYLANYISEKHPDIKVYWVIEGATNTDLLSNNIHVIGMDSAESRNIFSQAGVIVMNQEFTDFSKSGYNLFGGAITINLWHGLMWKKIGFDIRKKHGFFATFYHRIEKKIENADYWLVPSEEAKKHFQTAFLIDDKHSIKCGYPRNQIFYDDAFLQKIRKQTEQLVFEETNENIHVEKILAYMPTFRDNTDEVFSFSAISEDTRLRDLLEKHHAVIIEKSHFVSSIRKKSSGEVKQNGRILFVDSIQATELLASSDLLITDYSSCFFDFLLLDRPIIHYIYDYDYYVNNDRVIYYKKEEIACGKTPMNVEELLDALEEYLIDPTEDHELRDRQRRLFWEYDSKDTCERIYQEIDRICQGREET